MFLLFFFKVGLVHDGNVVGFCERDEETQGGLAGVFDFAVFYGFMRLGMGAEMRYVQKLVELHMRPIALVEDEVTDSAVRRLINYAEQDLDDLMLLARADITSKNEEKKQRFLENFDIVERKYEHIRSLDAERARRNPVDGNEIMHIFGLAPSPAVGMLVSTLKQAIKDCEIEDTRESALRFPRPRGSSSESARISTAPCSRRWG